MTYHGIAKMVKQRIVNDRVWQIIAYNENDTEKFDVVYFNKSDADKMATELISSKETIETFEDMEKATKFLNEV
jgi:hypothetical protein